MYINPKLRWW